MYVCFTCSHGKGDRYCHYWESSGKDQLIRYTRNTTMHKLPLLVDVPHVPHLEYAWYLYGMCVCQYVQITFRLTGPFMEPHSRKRSVGRPQHGYWEGGQPKEQHYWIIRISVENKDTEEHSSNSELCSVQVSGDAHSLYYKSLLICKVMRPVGVEK